MMVRLQPVNIMVWSLILVMALFVTGCGHRSSHGSQAHSKKFNKARMVAHQPTGSDLTVLKGPAGGEGYFGQEAASLSDALNADTFIQEDPQFGYEENNTGSPNDYWVNRTRAEQFTAQAGLEDVHFDFNSIQLSEQAKTILMANAEWLKAHPHAEMTIEGHCDDRGTSSYNYVLGEKRALRTKAFLTSLGVSGERLKVMSFGKDNPACWDPTEPCYHKNRRAHLVLGLKVASTVMR
ncbi:MAG: OmpA family protein [Nitrospirota bacterium]|nr:OmpA family protein [Nitrospirota bacterium]MDH5587154.1 OmpA family protein [Nitrospirota bacterium]MDH5776533.1 OmpA family protein [Nitrospirota bacterium]